MKVIKKYIISNIEQQYHIYMNTNNFDINKPKLFTEKIQWLKINDNIPLKTYCADKINVRNYCRKKLGKDICPKILKIYNMPDNINIYDIPKKCIIKCNHGSGMNIICDSQHEFNRTDIEQLKIWYNTDFSILTNELFYANIPHKIFIEELLNIQNEYKIFCFNGTPKIVQIIFYDDLDQSLYKGNPDYTKQWSRHDVLVDENYNFLDKWQFNVPRPTFNEIDFLKENYKKYKIDNFDTIINYSKKLSNDFKFVRVDFYITKQKDIYLSELTFAPSSGFINFNSKQTDLEIGNLLTI